MQNEQLVAKLNDKRMKTRLKALKALTQDGETQTLAFEKDSNINCVFRTVYSCFDRSPSLAVYYTYKFGMPLTGLVDYASLSSAEELIKAEKFAGGTYYCGAEVAVKSPKGERIVLSAVGIPHKNVKAFNDDLAPYRSQRLAFTNALREKLNSKFKKYSISLPYAFWSLFGAVKTTSVEDLYVNLASKIVEKFKTADLINKFLIEDLGFEFLEDESKKLSDETSTLYLFDLSYALKNKLKIKLPEEQLHTAEHFLSLCEKYGAISSATFKGGDLDEFLSNLKALNINSATAEFSANDQGFMQEFYDKCMQNGILPFVRTLVSHPRKKPDNKFTDVELAVKFNDTASCIVGHEISSSINPEDGMFTKTTAERFPSLEERIKLYSRVGTK
ncbi:MAG: hypothetical protein IJW64_05830 [Clostridia bacterium]|nr:hypothetical protein [Clostridia bacterium]